MQAVYELEVNPGPRGRGQREAQGKVLENTKLVNAFQCPALFIVQCGSEMLRDVLR